MTNQLTFARYDRVRDRSAQTVNQRIDDTTRGRLERLKDASVAQIGRRLGELDREWDVDRALMATFAVLGGANLAVGLSQRSALRRGNGWLYTLSVQMTFLLVHAIAGWCPPVAVLRRMGFRTSKEVEAERRAVEAMLHAA